MTFDEACNIVATNTELEDDYPDGFVVDPEGFENSTNYLVVISAVGDLLDTPTVFVDKATADVRIVYGLQVAGDPTEGMTPVFRTN